MLSAKLSRKLEALERALYILYRSFPAARTHPVRASLQGQTANVHPRNRIDQNHDP